MKMEDSMVAETLRDIFHCDPVADDSKVNHHIWMRITDYFGKNELERLMALATLSGYNIYMSPSDRYLLLSLYRLK